MLRRDKKGVSVMIGYVLLIVGAIIMGGLVYSWLKSYVPQETIECPDGVSIFIEDISCQGGILKIMLTNNGGFNIDAFGIKSGSPTAEIATRDISALTPNGQAGVVLFSGGRNKLAPGESTEYLEFELEHETGLVEITPVRFEVVRGQNKLVSCGKAKIKETVDCGIF